MTAVVFAKENKDYILEKIFSCSVALAILYAFSPEKVRDSYIILGQAHFTLTYLYQIKTGKATPRTLSLFTICMTTLYTAAMVYQAAFTLFAATTLIFHTNVAEVKLQKRRMNIGYLFLMTSIMLINSAELANALWGHHIDAGIICYFIMAIGIPAGILYLVKAQKPLSIDASVIFMIAMLLVYIWLELSGHFPSPYKSFGFIVIAHYMTFYVVTARKFYREDRKKLLPFLTQSAILNFCMVTGYFALLYKWIETGAVHSFVYQLWYLPVAFYAWTVMHFVSTLNAGDYTGALGLRVSKLSPANGQPPAT